MDGKKALYDVKEGMEMNSIDGDKKEKQEE